MNKTISSFYVTIALASVEVPASAGGVHRAGRHLVGIALLIARQDRKGRWRFRLKTSVIAAGEQEQSLLEWAADLLPADAILIGWNIDHVVMPALLDAVACANALTAYHFSGRLARLLKGPAVDMSLGFGGAGAATLASVAADMAIYAPAGDEARLMADWALGRKKRLGLDLADEALALWQVFLRRAGLGGMDAEAATLAWMGHRVIDLATLVHGTKSPWRFNAGG